MKKLLCCAFIALIAVVPLSGCKGKESELNVSMETAVEYKEGNAELDPVVNTAEEIIGEAMKVYSWFETQPLKYDEDVTTVFKDSETGEESHLYRVIYSNLNTEENLRAYLKNYFCDEIVEELINNGVYKTGKDGYLYTSSEPKSKARDNISVQYRTVEISDNEYIYEAIVTDSESEKTETYRYEYAKIDGKWVFIEFNFIL